MYTKSKKNCEMQVYWKIPLWIAFKDGINLFAVYWDITQTNKSNSIQLPIYLVCKIIKVWSEHPTINVKSNVESIK